MTQDLWETYDLPIQNLKARRDKPRHLKLHYPFVFKLQLCSLLVHIVTYRQMPIFKCLPLRLHPTIADRKTCQKTFQNCFQVLFPCHFLIFKAVGQPLVPGVPVDSLMALSTVIATQNYEQVFAEETLQMLHIKMEVNIKNVGCLAKTFNDFYLYYNFYITSSKLYSA